MRSQIVDVEPTHPGPGLDIHEADEIPGEIEKPDLTPQRQDAFGDEENAEIKYKTLKWWYVLMILCLFSFLTTFPGREVYLWWPKLFP
jgi:hypothetical protein